MAHSKKRYMKRHEDLKRERSSWLDHWKDLADHLSPRRFRLDNVNRNMGTKRNQKILNNTGVRASRVARSGMHAGITSPARPWFKLTIPDPEAKEARSVRSWLHTNEVRMRDVMSRSNLYNALPTAYGDILNYGVSPLFIEEDDRDVIRCHVFPIASYCIALDHRYRVNALYRDTTLTVEQIIRKFGDPTQKTQPSNISQQIAKKWADDEYDTVIDLEMVIEQNDEQEAGAAGYRGMPWRSAWYEPGGSDLDPLLGVGGFEEMPVMVPRWDTTGEDMYSESPGMEALPDLKMLMHYEKRMAMALDKIVNPPMNAPMSLKGQRASILSGDVNYATAAAAHDRFQPAHEVDSRVMALKEILDRIEGRISATFMADLFLTMLAGRPVPNRTAREVEEISQEKMLQLGPALERLEDELLDPMIHRIFGIMTRRGMVPPPPPELEGSDYNVEYISILAQAQKLVGTVSVERLLSLAADLSSIKPEVLDKVDFDKAMDEYSELLGTPPDLVRATEDAERIREVRAQEQQAAQESAAAAKDLALAGKAASETDLGNDSALDRMLAAAGSQGPPGGEQAVV